MMKVSVLSFFNLLLFTFLYIGEGRAQSLADKVNLESPDKLLSVVFYQKIVSGRSTMYYTVSYKGLPLIKESELGVRMDNSLSEKAMALKVDTARKWCENLRMLNTVRHSVDSIWSPVNGEQKMIRDHYNCVSVEMVKADNPIYRMIVEFRAYNEGIAFRYYFPENPKGTYYNITSEDTEFSMPEGTTAWFANWAQAPYLKLPLHDWPGESERPLTLVLPGNRYVCLTEARMTDYARTKFRLSKTKANTLITSMAGEAALISPFATPWRVVMVADRPGDLILRNGILLNLNPPTSIKNAEWIKPGKIMRVMDLTTAAAHENIDFAVAMGLQYILFDWKWYGPAFSFNSDATKVAVPDFDLPEIISYAATKGIGVWLYVNQQALLLQSDSLFHTYRKWGIKGVKFGFVQVGSHRWTTWLEKAIRQAADEHIMVNIHDDWRPTGEQRTWPNLMTAEGVRGNEEMPDATHNTVLPFTRYIAGPADYTICYFDKRIKTTYAHQLALAAIYYSPIQTLFWYDRPQQYNKEPELEFWKKIPATWDETRVLSGAPGQSIVTARRHGEDWFVGSITNNEARKVDLSFAFLPQGRSYTATLYSDDAAKPGRTHVKITRQRVNSKTIISSQLQPSGGQAIYLTPER